MLGHHNKAVWNTASLNVVIICLSLYLKVMQRLRKKNIWKNCNSSSSASESRANRKVYVGHWMPPNFLKCVHGLASCFKIGHKLSED